MDDAKPPTTKQPARGAAAERRARLAAALRDNLRKRKAQQRGRAGASESSLPGDRDAEPSSSQESPSHDDAPEES